VGLINKLRNLLPNRRGLIRSDPVTYRPIGVVRNGVREPRLTGWEDVRSDIFLLDEMEPALLGIEGFSHVIVVFHLDRITAQVRPLLKLPLAGENEGEIGVFATRVPARPNPIGIAVVPVLRRRKSVLRVRGLDALDGTPVLDIKPYLPAYDAVPDARLPGWASPAPGEP
jgi:tRNA-Thr(GGU) m(6)t(6)A37 methyltransferase TsaA